MLVGRVEIRLINIVPFFLNIYFEVPKVTTLDTFGVSRIKGSLPSKVCFFIYIFGGQELLTFETIISLETI